MSPQKGVSFIISLVKIVGYLISGSEFFAPWQVTFMRFLDINLIQDRRTTRTSDLETEEIFQELSVFVTFREGGVMNLSRYY